MWKVLIPAFILISVSNACAQTTSVAKPFVLGVIETLHSKILGEDRILNIYLPEGYRQGDTTSYPVVYLLDGSADEDFIHIVGLYQFNSFSWIARVPPTIVVGIATVDRRRDFTFPTSIEGEKKAFPSSGQSHKFIRFLENELQPFIGKTYRGTRTRTLIGQSLGGLLATQILLENPSLFDQYMIVSPSLWWNGGSMLRQSTGRLKTEPGHPVKVYIGVGKEGLTPGDPPRVMEVDANLLAEKIRSMNSMEVHFDYLPGEDHGTILHLAVFNALRLLHPKGKQ